MRVEVELILFILRIVSALLLVGMVGALFWILWRDYQSTLDQVRANRRSHGQLVALQEMDGTYILVGEVYPLLPITTLGRAPTNAVIVNDSFASSEHAMIVLRSGQWWLEDRQSRNGTLLNDIPVRQPMVMTNGDVIGIGNRRYRLELQP
ncbi:MAG: FHA domain-containing protein [bacterium]|nr:FHA domain-containing protein [bacterium]